MCKICPKSILFSLSRIADTPTSTEDEKIAHSFLIYLGTFMSVGGIIWGSICFASGLTLQSVFPYAYTVITLFNFTYLYFSKNFRLVQNIQVLISLLLPFVFQIFLGGFVSSGAVTLWSILTILGSFTFQDKSVTIKWFALYIVLVILSGVIDEYIHSIGIALPDVPRGLSVLFFTLNITLISSIIFGLFYYFVYSKEKLESILETLASTDPLTGLPNRRSFFSNAQKEFSRARRYKIPFSVMMLDIDFFKLINDTHGHGVGDEALKQFSTLLKECTRDTDVLGRYGGEEFVVMLPETPILNVHTLAERILKQCQSLTIKTSEGSCAFTVSIGLTEVKESDENMEEILKRADDALYQAKENGRNQCQEA